MGSKKKAKKDISQVTDPNAPLRIASDGLQPEINDQDIKRRIGDFQGAGEPARKGGRKGIVGQTSKKFKNDKRK